MFYLSVEDTDVESSTDESLASFQREAQTLPGHRRICGVWSPGATESDVAKKRRTPLK